MHSQRAGLMSERLPELNAAGAKTHCTSEIADPLEHLDRAGPAPRIGSTARSFLVELGLEAAEVERLAAEKIVRW